MFPSITSENMEILGKQTGPSVNKILTRYFSHLQYRCYRDAYDLFIEMRDHGHQGGHSGFLPFSKPNTYFLHSN